MNLVLIFNPSEIGSHISNIPLYLFNFLKLIFHWPGVIYSLIPLIIIPISPLTSNGLGPVKYIEYLELPIVPSWKPSFVTISPVLPPLGETNSILNAGNIDLYKFTTTVDSSDETLKYTSFISSKFPPTWCAASPSFPAAITIVTLSIAAIVDIYCSSKLLPLCAPSLVLKLMFIAKGVFSSLLLSIRNFIPLIIWVLNANWLLATLTIAIELSGATP